MLYERLSLWEFLLWMKLSWASCDPHSRSFLTKRCQAWRCRGASSLCSVPAALSSPENCACMCAFCGPYSYCPSLLPSLSLSLLPGSLSAKCRCSLSLQVLQCVGVILTGDPLLPHPSPHPPGFIIHSLTPHIGHISVHIFLRKRVGTRT